MRPLRSIAASGLALTGLLAGAAAAPAGALDVPVAAAACTTHAAPSNETVTSKAADRISVAITVFKPCSASAETPVPVIFQSHGWAGSRSKTGFAAEQNAGFAVVSIDQRGHGDTGGQANVEDPSLEAQDIKAVIDHVAAKDWVRKDVDAEGKTIANDPVLFAVGGSYGGGYQMITALTEVRESGKTRFNALAPEITWYDLSQSLAPNGVPRTVWGALLYGVGAASVDMAPFITETFAYASATGQWPNGTALGLADEPTDLVTNSDAIYRAHSPVAFVKQGIRLDIPVIWRQGISDTLFPLNEGISNFQQAFTAKAQSRSVFVGHNGGHVLPSAYPLNGPGSGDACSPGGFGALTREFFAAAASGQADPSAALFAAHPELRRYNLTTEDNACVRMDALPAGVSRGVGNDDIFEDAWMTTSGVSPAVQLEVPDIAAGSTIAGIPRLSGLVTVAGVDQRVFFALSRGTSMENAEVINANLQPLRVNAPSTEIQEDFSIELPGVAVKLGAGEKLWLTITGTSDQFIGHGSRAPGWIGLTDLEVNVPLVG